MQGPFDLKPFIQSIVQLDLHHSVDLDLIHRGLTLIGSI
jgi:hypothetical protein